MKRIFSVLLVVLAAYTVSAQLKTEDYDNKAAGDFDRQVQSQVQQMQGTSEGQMDEATMKELLKELQKSKEAIQKRNEQLEKMMNEM